MIDAMMQSFWIKVIAGALAAGGAAAGGAGVTAVVRTHTLQTRVEVVEADNLDQEARIRADHDSVVTLQSDVKYTREAVSKLLRHHGLESAE